MPQEATLEELELIFLRVRDRARKDGDDHAARIYDAVAEECFNLRKERERHANQSQ